MAKKRSPVAVAPHTARRDPGTIVIRGARVHNLKNINLDIPRNRLIVITGVSGSGKSSLAFDTIYAEGQRRYVESLSSYARQFLDRMDRPDVDLIQGISPAMAIEQKTNTRNPRSTVGTSTEVYDYLRLLFGRIGRTFCVSCGREVRRDSVRTIREDLGRQVGGDGSLRMYVTFPLVLHDKETLAEAIAHLKKQGFFRLLVGNDIVDLTDTALPRGTKAGDILVLVDRVVFRPGEDDGRMADSLETAFSSGNGRLRLVLPDTGTVLRYQQVFECPYCTIRYEEPEPRLFSFNNPFGACPECQGFGRAIGIDMDLVVPDRTKSLRRGAIQPWTTPKFRSFHDKLIRAATAAGVRIDVPYHELSADETRFIVEGGKDFDGVLEFFHDIEKKAYKIYYRVLLSRYRGYTMCPSCRGGRLRQEALHVRVDGKNIADIVRMSIAEARRFFQEITLTDYEQDVAKRILAELRKRLTYLDEVGIGYLTLDRLSNTLSGGESQRINLATSLGSTLMGATYVLDEPSIGLHPRDNGRLIRILKALRDAGNTVIVVEHDVEMMRASDVIVDMGPRAGERGGEVVYAGPAGKIVEDEHSLTGKYLRGALSIPVPKKRRKPTREVLSIIGASEHNLKGIDVRIPLHLLVCVTGVSGSGKSTLVHDVLCAGLRRIRGEAPGHVGAFASMTGYESIQAVELVDQSPIGRSPRSNPTTYIQVFDLVRAVFASTQAAKIHGFQPGHFSFNVPGGRCETCEGDGVIRVEMQFLADLYLVCDACKGKRYKKEVLDITFHGVSIDGVLAMTVTEAIAFFGAHAEGRKIAARLKVLDDVGLGYIRLGQSSASLSGGEAQRIKLAAHLTAPERAGHTLFVFDEPTTGLHMDDIAKLLTCFTALVEAGHSVVIIEHNLDVIKSADHVIDLGPEAGPGGGEVVVTGTPEELATHGRSHTGRFLGGVLSSA